MSRRVLVIDDDEITIALVAYRLQKEGLNVDSARDGVSAIAMMKNQSYDVILLDILMPRLDGFGVLQYLDENHPEMRARVIVMTALAETRDLRVDGTFRTLKKPLDYGELLKVVRERISAPVGVSWTYDRQQFDRNALPN